MQYFWFDNFLVDSVGRYALGLHAYNVVMVGLIAFALAAMSYQVVEKPSLGLKRHFPDKRYMTDNELLGDYACGH